MGPMAGCPTFESVRFSFTERPPGPELEQWSVGPCAGPHSGVCSLALGKASVQVWMYCGDHILFWWASWSQAHRFRIASMEEGGGGEGGRIHLNSNIALHIAYHDTAS